MAASRALGTPSEWASQAAVNALLRYAPQKEALRDLQRAAAERFQESVQAGRSEGRLGAQAAEQAVAPTKQIFSTAAAQGARGQSLAAPILAALSASSPFRAAAANEAASGGERLAQSEAHALSDLQQKKVAATELPAFTRSAAMAALLKELSKLQSKGAALEGLEGADRQSEVQKQRGEAQKAGVSEQEHREANATSERNTAAHDKTAERDAALTHSGKGKGAELLTRKEQNEGASVISQIRHYAGEAGEGLTRAQLVAALTEGAPQGSTKNAKGETVKIPKVPAFKPDVRMSAALDLAEYGHLSPATERRLERAGYDLGRLGLPRATSKLTRSQQESQHRGAGSRGA